MQMYIGITTLAVYVYIIGSLMSNQHLDPNKWCPKHQIDLFIPINSDVFASVTQQSPYIFIVYKWHSTCISMCLVFLLHELVIGGRIFGEPVRWRRRRFRYELAYQSKLFIDFFFHRYHYSYCRLKLRLHSCYLTAA